MPPDYLIYPAGIASFRINTPFQSDLYLFSTALALSKGNLPGEIVNSDPSFEPFIYCHARSTQSPPHLQPLHQNDQCSARVPPHSLGYGIKHEVGRMRGEVVVCPPRSGLLSLRTSPQSLQHDCHFPPSNGADQATQDLPQSYVPSSLLVFPSWSLTTSRPPSGVFGDRHVIISNTSTRQCLYSISMPKSPCRITLSTTSCPISSRRIS